MAIGRVKKGDPPQYAPIRLGADLHVTFWVQGGYLGLKAGLGIGCITPNRAIYD